MGNTFTLLKLAVKAIQELVPTITTNTIKEIRKLNGKSKPSSTSMKSLKVSTEILYLTTQDQLRLLPVLIHLVTSSFFKTKVVTQQFVEDISFLITQVEDLVFIPAGSSHTSGFVYFFRGIQISIAPFVRSYWTGFSTHFLA